MAFIDVSDVLLIGPIKISHATMFLLGGVLLLLCLLRFGRMQPLQLTNQLGHFLKLTLFISSWDNNNTRTVIARLFFFF